MTALVAFEILWIWEVGALFALCIGVYQWRKAVWKAYTVELIDSIDGPLPETKT